MSGTRSVACCISCSGGSSLGKDLSLKNQQGWFLLCPKILLFIYLGSSIAQVSKVKMI